MMLQKGVLFNSVDSLLKKDSRRNSLLTDNGFVGIINILAYAGLICRESVKYNASDIFYSIKSH
jgi:hypothetical protein